MSIYVGGKSLRKVKNSYLTGNGSGAIEGNYVELILSEVVVRDNQKL
ncbi:hypothetical protein KGY79_11805 [Candidatus Bipolaricaulota bacterium]|nr:hypothetical protein [Candidatus Bipolaricaulota bacterium]